MARRINRWIWLVLLVAAAQTPFVAFLVKPPQQPRRAGGWWTRGLEPLGEGWIDPDLSDWPLPMSRAVKASFGYREYDVRAEEPGSGGGRRYSLELREFGWPLVVLRQRQLWGPADVVGWDLPLRPDSDMQVVLSGWIWNALLLGTVLAVVIYEPSEIVRSIRSRRRGRRSQCVACGYPRGVSPFCTECGRPFEMRGAVRGIGEKQALPAWVQWFLKPVAALTLLACAACGPWAASFCFGLNTRTEELNAVQRGWPAPPPAAWPAPTMRQDMQLLLGWTRTDARHVEGNDSTFSMDVQRFGWPFPVFERRQFWWPWNDPQWKTDVPPESGLRVCWAGLAGNSLGAGLLVYLLLIAPLGWWRATRARVLRRGSYCANCTDVCAVRCVCARCGGSVGDDTR